MTHAIYRVIGTRAYRGHAPGTEFTDRIPRLMEARAVKRGAIEVVDRITPALRPGSYALPANWIRR